MLDATYPLFSIFSFLGFVLVLIPLPWHLQAWNSGTCYFMMWTAIACLNQFVNSVVWANDAIVRTPGWCDLSIRIIMAASVGIPASSLCINRRLYHIASVSAVTITRAEKFRAVLIDSLICVLFPLIYVALQYIVQGHRFNIYEQIGCYPALYNSLPMYFISMMWPILIGAISAVYCILSLRCFARRRAEFNQFLASNKSLTASRYFRLMALATTEICLTTPLAAFMIYLNATVTEVGPWISLADTHFDFFRIEQFAAILWRSNGMLVVALEFTRWMNPLCAFVFFSYFGFAVEARKNYSLAFWKLAKCVGYTPKTSTTSAAGVSIGQFQKPKSVPITSIALDAYAPSPTSSSFTDVKRPVSTDTESFTGLKRAESFASTTPTSASSLRFDTTPTPTSSSRFVEHAPYPPLSRARSLV
ncbi:pheromone A receptor-domain-containing protein [Mycena rebaudengoi]|nr:pheromone A receptor-domain-containing protein [Mycena rebaudengoi]